MRSEVHVAVLGELIERLGSDDSNFGLAWKPWLELAKANPRLV